VIPLRGVTVTIRHGGINVRAQPDLTSDKLGHLAEGARQPVQGLAFRDYTWLQIPWSSGDGTAWIAGEFTDFPRSAAYNQVVRAWYESDAVLHFRRDLVYDMLLARGLNEDRAMAVYQLGNEALAKLEETITRQTIPSDYVAFWRMQAHLGLPVPFDYLPVHPSQGIDALEVAGFGPNTFAFHNWSIYYDHTRGMHSGIDYIVPEGSPLIAVCDGVIVDFSFMGNPAEQSLTLRAYLPEKVRTPDGSRVLSNLLIAYGHLTGDPTSRLVKTGDEVKAGQIIGTSGWPVYTRDDGSTGVQYNNAHLHLETHLVTDGKNRFGSRTPFNPLLFWSPRLVAWFARLAAHRDSPPYPAQGQPFGKLGFFSVGCFSYDPPGSIVWNYAPTSEAPWPPGVYTLDAMLNWVGTFAPYQAG
jgi:murein DD-endopeptidase MepM/ murein hydrolase activator NlpD